MEAAKQEFVRAATMGEISTAVREAKGFQTQPLNPDIWSVVNTWNVFTSCVLNPLEPRSIYVAGTKYLPVMVERACFDAWLGERRKEALADASKPRSRGGRSVHDPLGPMNHDVLRAIETATGVWTENKMAKEDDVFEAVKATGNTISRRSFDRYVIPAARQDAKAPAKRGPRPAAAI
ncbi:hypothetical protein [Bosea sp. (in: a-proteobacteria)]|uniref:hypothetical protein n=1 Tax=Bosea sp. (in: a-proteobacteria) TaxID=1871050 RepID=UPI001AC601AF|nr:hypothetical protein [Bosea sp. (in: a-proteobacteria)]MBN9440697.1 hypothetical protein [Bosea sp. (in: a-proteobacteria)]